MKTDKEVKGVIDEKMMKDIYAGYVRSDFSHWKGMGAYMAYIVEGKFTVLYYKDIRAYSISFEGDTYEIADMEFTVSEDDSIEFLTMNVYKTTGKGSDIGVHVLVYATAGA